jgi:hypothetical protein
VPSSIESESASNITPTDATLEAEIDPGGLETTYEVMLEAPSCQSVNPPGSCEASGGVEIASGTIPTGASAQTVSIDIAQAWGHSLSPSTSYAYFFRAANSAGEAFGAQREFETPAASPPTIEGESASNITPTDARLEAEINLHEASAGVYYQFQLVTDLSEYASEILCPPTLQPGTDGCIGPQGSGALPIGFLPGNTLQPSATSHASLDLASAGVTLQPGTTYHYRVLTARAVQTEDTIEWEAPTVHGADQTFTTPLDPPPPSSQTGAGTSVQLPTTQSALSPSSLHNRRHRHQRRHKRPLHRGSLGRASLAG